MRILLPSVYVLCLLTSFAAMLLLLRSYLQNRTRLLLWSALCFIGLSLNNILVFADLIVFPARDLRITRAVTALVAMLFLLYGFIWETES